MVESTRTTPLQVVSPLHRALRQVTIALTRRSRALGIVGRHGHVLSYLSVYGPCTIAQLRKVFGHPPSTMTSLLDRLVADGLVLREPDPDDRRTFRVSITAAGRRQGERARAMVEAFEGEILKEIDPGDLRGFRRVVEVIGDVTGVVLRKETE